MLKLIFGFQGKIDRKAFVLGVAAGWVGLLAIALASVAVGMLTGVLSLQAGYLDRAAAPGFSRLGALVIVVVIVPLYFWGVCALYTKRVRSIGLPVIPSVVALMALPAIEQFVLQPLLPAHVVQLVDRLTHSTGLLSLIGMLALAIWPAREKASRSRRATCPVEPRATFGLRG